MTQNWIHTTEATTDFAAHIEMRSNRSLPVGLCTSFEGSNYQPKLGGLDRRTKDF